MPDETAEFRPGLLRLLRLEPGTPVTVDGTMEEGMGMEPMELGVENMGCDERGLTFIELKKGKVLAERVLVVRPLVAQLLYE